jgi:hypothetical protein
VEEVKPCLSLLSLFPLQGDIPEYLQNFPCRLVSVNHPNDFIGYRIEPLFKEGARGVRDVLWQAWPGLIVCAIGTSRAIIRV